MPEHPNAQLMRDFYAAFGAADRQRLDELVTDDFVWRFPGTSAYAGDFHGIDEIFAGIRNVAMTLGRGHNGFELLHVFADDDTAVTVHRDTYSGDDNHLDLRYVLYVRIRGGRMAEVVEVPFDQGENDRYVGRQTRLFFESAAQGEPATSP